MIGTMMACAPNLMDQEQAYRELMEKATSASLTTDGKLEVVSASGATIRFIKK
jgi:heat shock protein HslJ